MRGEMIMRFMRNEKIHYLSSSNYNTEEKVNYIKNEIYKLTKESSYTVDIYYYNTLLENTDYIENLYRTKRINCMEISNRYSIQDLYNVIREKYNYIKTTNVFNVVPSILIIDDIHNINRSELETVIEKLLIFIEFVNMFIYIF